MALHELVQLVAHHDYAALVVEPERVWPYHCMRVLRQYGHDAVAVELAHAAPLERRAEQHASAVVREAVARAQLVADAHDVRGDRGVGRAEVAQHARRHRVQRVARERAVHDERSVGRQRDAVGASHHWRVGQAFLR